MTKQDIIDSLNSLAEKLIVADTRESLACGAIMVATIAALQLDMPESLVDHTDTWVQQVAKPYCAAVMEATKCQI